MERENQIVEPKYMNSTKKHYYLASVNENVQQLIKQEIDGLTSVLIDLKSQYDILSKESIEKKLQTDELTKKIDSLQKMEKNSKNMIEDTNTRSKNLANLIKEKRTELNEGLYQMKTLLGNINKLKRDNFLIQKKINVNENITKRLTNNNQLEKIKETVLKGKKNKVFSEIENQIKKNAFEKDEQNLQLHYYRTIIDQKKMFIRTDDERKERQKKLAEEAKNNSADKQEVEKRKILCLLKLYNIYLENEMGKSLRENEIIETTFRDIRDIVGSPSLKVIVDKILTKETTYNESLAQIHELENQIEVYDKDIEELKNKLKLLKNEQIVQQNDDKNLSTIQSNLIQENENQLINEEKKLIEEEEILKDKLLQINLIYKKIMENIEYFVDEYKYNEENKKEEKIIKKKYNYDETNDNNFQQATMTGQSTVFDPLSTKNDFNKTKTTFQKQNIVTPLMTRNDFHTNVSGMNTTAKKKFFSRGSTPRNKIFEDICMTTESDMKKKEDSMKPPSEKEKNYQNKQIYKDYFEKEESLFDDMTNSNEIIKNYNNFLNWLNQKFDKFFLCYNKEQFKAAMAEKGENITEQKGPKKSNQNQERMAERRVTKKRRTKRYDGLYGTRMHVDGGAKDNLKDKEKGNDRDNEIEDDEDDFNVKMNEEANKINKFRKKDNRPSSDIFQRFVDEQNNKNFEFIHEKELRNKNKKQNV